MEQDKEKTPPSSAGCDTDGCEKRENSAQKDEMNEKRKESLFEHEEGRRSITEEQEIADEEISGKVVQEKVPAETISNLPRKPFYPFSTFFNYYFSKRLHGMAVACIPYRKSDFKQSKPHSASASVPSCSEISNVIFRGSRTAEKQKEQMFPFKWTKPGSLSDSVPFSAAFDSKVTSHNTPKVEQPVKEIKKPDHATLVQQNTLTALREKIKRKSGLCSPALSGPSSSSHLSSLSESIGLFDTTSPYSPCNRSLINIIGESLQKDAFSVQSRSEPEVNHSFVGDMGSLVTAEQSLIRKKNGADKSKPQSKVSSTSPVMSAGILRDTLKQYFKPGIAVNVRRTDSELYTNNAHRKAYRDSSPFLSVTLNQNPSHSELPLPVPSPSSIHELFPHCHNVLSSSVSHIGFAENKLLRRTKSLANMLLKSSVVDFTPVITDDGYDESYRFLCSSPGLYQCSVTDLVFHMDGEGEVVYRIVPWNRRLLAQHHKQPAGPLFDIKCLQQSVCQLHLPHCEIRSTGGCEFLSVAHVHDEGIEFIRPHQITDTHVIINITGFSGFGNVKDEDSPPDPVRALVLLFYKPPAAPDVTSVLSVLMLPRNVVLREVLRTRKKLVGDENYIDRPPHCKLYPQQEYTLSTRPEDESVLVQPKTAEFECESYDNYFSSFQVDIEQILKHINLFLRDSNEHSVWERRVCLSSTGVKMSCVQSESTERLLEIRSSFIDGISGPVLKSLLDRLLEKTVITDCERESADAIQDKGDKARFVIDTVRKKGEAASSEMIEYLREVDPFLCEHLGLI